jgi:hypothetical protein
MGIAVRKLRSTFVALICVIVSWGVEAKGRSFVGHPDNTLAKIEEPGYPEGVFVSDLAPDENSFRNSVFEFFNFGLGINPRQWRGKNEGISWSEHSDAVLAWVSGNIERKVEIVPERIIKNISSGPVAHLISWGQPASDKLDSRLEPISSLITLRNYSDKIDCKKSPCLQLANQLLPLSKFLVDFNALDNLLGVDLQETSNFIHCHCGLGSLRDGIAHVLGLSGGNFIHLFDGLPQSASLEAKYPDLDGTYHRENTRQTDHPPVGIYFSFALVLVSGGFLLTAYSGARRGLIGIGCLCGAAGFWLLWLI